MPDISEQLSEQDARAVYKAIGIAYDKMTRDMAEKIPPPPKIDDPVAPDEAPTFVMKTPHDIRLTKYRGGDGFGDVGNTIVFVLRFLCQSQSCICLW